MKIYIPIAAAIAIVLGLVFIIGAQGGVMPGAKIVLHMHPHLNVTVDASPVIIPKT
jgi:hypothetical protein